MGNMDLFEQFSEIRIITKQMLQALQDKPNIEEFNALFDKRTDLFEHINITDPLNTNTKNIIKSILLLDKEIEECMKRIQKQIAAEQIRVIHAKRSLESQEHRFDSYIDYKK